MHELQCRVLHQRNKIKKERKHKCVFARKINVTIWCAHNLCYTNFHLPNGDHLLPHTQQLSGYFCFSSDKKQKKRKNKITKKMAKVPQQSNCRNCIFCQLFHSCVSPSFSMSRSTSLLCGTTHFISIFIYFSLHTYFFTN